MRLLVPVLALCLACAGLGTPVAPPAPPAPPDAPVDAVPPEPAPEPVPAAMPLDADAPPPFPLTAGDAWRWEVVRSTGAGTRVLLMTSEPARSDVIETWTLQLGEPDADGRFPATFTRTPVGDGLPLSSAMKLWTGKDGVVRYDAGKGEQVALELTVPPNPVSVEHVPCTANLLGGYTGLCSPAPGGPLAIAPGPVRATIRADRDGAAAAVQLLVGIATVGTIIPGNRSSREVAGLVSFETTRPPFPSAPAVEAFKRRSSVGSLATTGALDRESAAAIVALAEPSDVPTAVQRLAPRLAARDRWPLLRVAVQKAGDTDASLAVIARARDAAPLEETAIYLPSLLALLPPDEADAATALVHGSWPLLDQVVKAAPADRLGILRAAAAARPPGSDEAAAVVRRISEARSADRIPAVEALVAHVDEATADRLMLDTLDDDGLFDARLELLARSDAWLARQARDPEATRAMLQRFSFDDDRRAALRLVLAQAEPAGRPALVRAGIEALTFDDAQLETLREHADLARAMGTADRERTIAAFTFKKDEARAIFDGRDPGPGAGDDP